MTGNGLISHTLREHRGMTAGMGLAIFAIAVLIVALYPSLKEQYGELDLPAAYEGFLGEASMATPEGFLAAEYFSWVPLLLITMAVIAGTGIVAGAEGAGTLEVYLAQPLRRRDYLLRRLAGQALALGICSVLGYVGLLLGWLFIDLDITPWRLAQASFAVGMVGLLFLAASAWASAALPTRGSAAGVVTAMVVALYFIQLVASPIDAIGWMTNLTPFDWAGAPRILLHGADPLRMASLVAFTALFVVLAIRAFDRRDISAVARPRWLPRFTLPQRRVQEPRQSHVGPTRA